ncbi:hypothetical protein E1263_15740 [Kribbella antibiotica]|uniref:Leucine-rich repeat domain-containing protein n=1 Tax=Kribbella antibiotica TaxID=190195 RepID=A0A4R4ZKD7_9ACTN|nr:hypothetical protein [Kribbella antibiotica]TDD59228.1 hypothetical protein E1263_15740 [Kribbella antibiotica]
MDLQGWEHLRVLRTRDAVGLAANPALSQLESLDLISGGGTTQPFRPPADRPLRLRHVSLLAPDLTDLLRAGVARKLRSATVLVHSLDEARALAARPELAQLEQLTIGFRCSRNGVPSSAGLSVGEVVAEDDAACTTFFAAATLSALREFGLLGFPAGRDRQGFGPAGLAGIVASGIFSRLTALTIKDLPLGDAAMIDVLAVLDHDSLDSVSLQNIALSDVAAEGFTGTYSALRTLDLRQNYLTESGAQHLAHDVDLPALERLDLSGKRSEIQPIGDAGAVAWASSHNAINLAELHLAATGLTAVAVPELLNTGELEILDLSYNQLTGWPLAERLPGRSLDLAACALNDEDLISLTTATADLDSLNLADNTIRSAKALTAWAALPALWELNLHGSHLDDQSLADLRAAATCLLELDTGSKTDDDVRVNLAISRAEHEAESRTFARQLREG